MCLLLWHFKRSGFLRIWKAKTLVITYNDVVVGYITYDGANWKHVIIHEVEFDVGDTVITTQTKGSFCMEVNAPKRVSCGSSTSGCDVTMDKTQSNEEKTCYSTKVTSTTEVTISPLKIGYEKPRLCCLLQFKTLSHIIATCLVPLILVNTVLIFKSTTFHDDVFREPEHLCELAGPFNLIALLFSLSHVMIWYYSRESTQKSANMTFWVTVLTTGSLFVSGFLLWTAHSNSLRCYQTIVPLQYICFFGSILAMSSAIIAVFHEWQASKYALTY